MNNELISVIDAAKQLKKYKQTLFKIIRKLKITPTKQKHSEHRGQTITYITQEEFGRIAEYFSIKQDSNNSTDIQPSIQDNSDAGVFYLIQLEPTHDPRRFKVGFATTMNDRLRQHRCSAPFATVIGTWPCRKLWEQTAIDCVTIDCEKVHTEVFRTDNIENVKNRCIQFFALMPKVAKINA